MDMKSAITDFFGSRVGRVVTVVVVALGCFLLVGRGGKPEVPSSRSSKLPRIAGSIDGISSEKALEQEAVIKVSKQFKPFQPSTPTPAQKEVAPPPSQPFVPMGKLVVSYEPEERAVPPSAQPPAIPELPPGILVPCRLFNGIESNLPETPLMAHVLSDVRIQGSVLIPKGSELHGTVRADDQRGRVMTGSAWQIVTPTGKVVKVSGIGLTRDYDPKRDIYGASDGFAGIEGKEVRQDQKATQKFLAATALSAVGKLSQQRNRTVFGEEVVTSLGNSAMEGGSAVAEEYARMRLKEMEKKRPFIRVAAGTEFYVYSQRPVPVKPEAESAGIADVLKQREQLMEELRGRLRASQVAPRN
jgi:type IV secretory pathway VirB10-like protein